VRGGDALDKVVGVAQQRVGRPAGQREREPDLVCGELVWSLGPRRWAEVIARRAVAGLDHGRQQLGLVVGDLPADGLGHLDKLEPV
jgi:hypothetical protein